MKKFFKIFGIILVILIGVYFFLVYRNMKVAKQNGEQVTLRDYFPFGSGSGSKIKDVIPGTNDAGTDGNGSQNGEQGGGEQASRLTKLYSGHVAGYTFVNRPVFAGEGDTEKATTVSITPKGVFTRELKLNSAGEDVQRLQQTLNSCPQFIITANGPGSKGQETTTLGQKTVDAIKKFQLAFKSEILTPRSLTEPTGIVDEATQAKLSKPFDCVVSKTSSLETPTKIAVRFVEKSNGNISDIILDSAKEYQVSNTTIPRIQEAFFLNNGKNVILRYLKENGLTISSYYGTVPEQKLGEDISEAPLTGTFLEDDIQDVTIAPNNQTVYFETTVGNNGTGVARDLSTKKQTILWQNPYTEWLSQWVNDSLVTLTTKASAFAPGYIYAVNPKTASFQKIIGNITGLTTNTSPDGKNILYSRSIQNGITTSIFNTETKKVYDLSLATLPEKCSWLSNTNLYCAVPKYLPAGVYPDDWYQSTLSFDDSFWNIDVSRLLDDIEVFDPGALAGETVDAVNLHFSPDGKYLLFKNKGDDSLWSYKL